MTEEKEIATESNGQENNKTDENLEEETELDKAIIQQVEYYFGDLNLPRDKFLREQVQLDDGWVPLDILIKFNRLAKLTTDTEIIAKALNKSSSGLLEISDDNKKIRRSPEMPIPEMNEERRKELSKRTIYAKGFPKDSNVDDMLKFFRQFQKVENLIMRKYLERSTKKRLFKGSVFATFTTREQAEKFMEIKDHKYQETELLTLWQDEYIQKKQEEYANRKEMKEKKNKEKEKEGDKPEFKLPTGTVLHFSEGTETMKREDIKDALTNIGGEIAYIDFKVGDKEGWVRLVKENTAKEIVEKLTDGKLKIGEADVVFKVLEDDEEKIYLDKTVEEMTKRRRNMKTFKHKQGGRQGKGGGRQGRKRKQDQDDDGPQKKTKAVDS